MIGGHERWCREEWERWHATSKMEKDLAGAKSFLGRADLA
jgi:hypothetical protein